MLKYTVFLKDGRSVGTIRYGRTYAVCEKSHCLLNCDRKTAMELARVLDADAVSVTWFNKAGYGMYSGLIWHHEIGYRREAYRKALTYEQQETNKIKIAA